MPIITQELLQKEIDAAKQAKALAVSNIAACKKAIANFKADVIRHDTVIGLAGHLQMILESEGTLDRQEGKPIEDGPNAGTVTMRPPAGADIDAAAMAQQGGSSGGVSDSPEG